MRKLFIGLLAGLLFIGCKKSIDEKEISLINGYWEIERTEMPDGSEKEFKVNPTIDFFEIKGKSGMRTKVMPQVDGTYLTNDVSEKITVTTEDDIVFLNYTTPFAKWKEKVISVSEKELVVENEQDIIYYYKKSKPFSVK
nr:lipocalin family protein [uncultured Flavobacterium sp.]